MNATATAVGRLEILTATALAFVRETHARWPSAFRSLKGVPWDLNGAKGTVTLTHSVSEFVTQVGTYEVDVRWQKGAHALQIEKVELWEGDRLVATDAHPGYAGLRRENTRYTLRLPAYRTGLEDYTVRITGSGHGGGDSSGIFTVSLLKEE